MHTSNNIAAEIVELFAYRSAYCHYLASRHAASNVENTTIVKQNKHITSHNINQLYRRLKAIKTTIEPAKDSFSSINYQYSAAEISAISHFNNDKRYTITE